MGYDIIPFVKDEKWNLEKVSGLSKDASDQKSQDRIWGFLVDVVLGWGPS